MALAVDEPALVIAIRRPQSPIPLTLAAALPSENAGRPMSVVWSPFPPPGGTPVFRVPGLTAAIRRPGDHPAPERVPRDHRSLMTTASDDVTDPPTATVTARRSACGTHSMRHDRRVPDLIAASIQRLRASGRRLEPGLSDKEVSRVQDRFGFAFGPEHRAFIQSAVPVGESWPDWREDSDEDLRERLDWPIEGVIYDVHNNGFWPASWGDRPEGQDEQERLARAHLARVPTLAPVFSHRYLTSAPQFSPSPVFSVHQTDVVFYGHNLLDYVAHEFGVPPLQASARTYVPFWSDLAGDAENRDL